MPWSAPTHSGALVALTVAIGSSVWRSGGAGSAALAACGAPGVAPTTPCSADPERLGGALGVAVQPRSASMTPSVVQRARYAMPGLLRCATDTPLAAHIIRRAGPRTALGSVYTER